MLRLLLDALDPAAFAHAGVQKNVPKSFGEGARVVGPVHRPRSHRAGDLRADHQPGRRHRVAHVARRRGRRQAFARAFRPSDGYGRQAVASVASEGFPRVACVASVGRLCQPARRAQRRAHDGQEPARVHPPLDRVRRGEEGTSGGAQAMSHAEASRSALVPSLVLGRLRFRYSIRAG